ncbi:MAG TPA: histidine kinase, partial [Candidatus Omnitrophica bacterium]|nr:histidine kinase [Candidatus Omnitrophota bacterium]
IALGARIISLADAYDVMTSIRSYRKDVFSKEQAIEEVKRNSGKQFDPKVVEAFLRIVDKF